MGLFEHLAHFDDAQRIAGRQAAAVAQKRISDRFGSYLKIAKSAEEYSARLSFVEDDVRQIVADVAEEYNADLDNLQEAIDEHLKGEGVTDINGDLEEAPSAVGHKAAGGHASDCTCGFCQNKGKLPGSDSKDEDDDSEESEVKESSTVPLVKEALTAKDFVMLADAIAKSPVQEKEALANHFADYLGQTNPRFDRDRFIAAACGNPASGRDQFRGEVPTTTDLQMPIASVKEADADRDGGGAVTREKLPTGDGETVGTEPVPKIDKKQWKPNAINDKGNLKPVDTETTGTPVPTVEQDVTDGPEYKSQADEGDSFLDQTDSVVVQQTLPTADETGQSTERNISQDGQDGTWTEAQGDPVTSEVLSSTDPDKNPLRTILESGFSPDEQVEAAIRHFESQ